MVYESDKTFEILQIAMEGPLRLVFVNRFHTGAYLF